MTGGGRLAGRVAFVTGGARGIGYGIAERFVAEGAKVAIADINAEGAQEAAERIKGADGAEAMAITTDISKRASIEAAVAATAERWGKLDILVNNAAVQDLTPFEGLDYDHFRSILRVNIDGALLCILAAADLLAESECPRILNIASILGLRAWPNHMAYATAKGGIINMTRAAAVDLAPRGILVNVIAPGFIDTPACIMADGRHEHETDWFNDIYMKYGRIPMGRVGLPPDIAGAALFFCSADCSYVTGQVLVVDGGMSATF